MYLNRADSTTAASIVMMGGGGGGGGNSSYKFDAVTTGGVLSISGNWQQ